MKKHLIATCVLLLLFSLLPMQGLAEKEGARKRAVTLVYDDSGSMRNGKDRWKYASYALQSFVGLLDERDSFSFIPMSNPSQEIALQLSKEKRQEEIERIRSWSDHKNTPFTAVETAIAALKRQVEINAEGEFWLIVLTDGAFNELESPNSAQYEQNKKRIIDIMNSFSAWMQSKKASLQSILITMDESLSAQEKEQMLAFQNIWKESINGLVFTAGEEKTIIQAVDQAAALIANRDPFSNAEEYIQLQAEGKKLRITTPFPLRRFTIVQQAEGAEQLVEVKSLTDSSLRLEGPFQMVTPETNLIQGSIIHAAPKTGVMDPGTYEVQFQSNIVTEKLKVLAEPSLDYKVQMYNKQGEQLIRAEKVYENSTIIIEAKPTDLPVDAGYVSASMTYNNETAPMNWNAARKAFQAEVKLGTASVRGTIHMNIKGFYRQSKEFQLQPVKQPKLSIVVKTQNWQERVDKLAESKPIIIQPLLNGKELAEQEVGTLLSTAKVTFTKRIQAKWEQHGNELYLYPRPYVSNTLNFTETGVIEATIVLQNTASQEVQETVVFTVDEASIFKRFSVIFQWVLPIVIGVLLIIFIIVGWVTRARFHRGGLIYYELDQSVSENWVHEAEPQQLRHSWWRHYLGIPYRAERRTVQSITFIAKKGTKAIWIAKESQVEGMKIDGSFLGEDELGKELKTLYPNETVVIERGYGKEVYRYECD